MYVPPWLSSSPQDFVKAAEAGARLGISISENETRANLERMKLEADKRGGGMPSIRGGIKLPVAEPVAPKGAHIGGMPGSPMLVDPARENQAPVVNQPFSLPGDVSGNKFVSSPSGEVVDYVAPPAPAQKFEIRTLPDGSIGRVGQDSGAVEVLMPATDKAATEQKYPVPVAQSKSGSAITIPMTTAELESKWHQFPEYGRTNDVSKIIRNLGRDRDSANQGEVVRVTKDGRKAVYDAATKRFLRYAE